MVQTQMYEGCFGSIASSFMSFSNPHVDLPSKSRNGFSYNEEKKSNKSVYHSFRTFLAGTAKKEEIEDSDREERHQRLHQTQTCLKTLTGTAFELQAAK